MTPAAKTTPALAALRSELSALDADLIRLLARRVDIAALNEGEVTDCRSLVGGNGGQSRGQQQKCCGCQERDAMALRAGCRLSLRSVH